MSGFKSTWETPGITELSIRETKALDGGDSDSIWAGIFLADAVDGPPGEKLSLLPEDMSSVMAFMRDISSSPEMLERAVFNPGEAMSGLSKNQVRVVKRIFNHLGG